MIGVFGGNNDSEKSPEDMGNGRPILLPPKKTINGNHENNETEKEGEDKEFTVKHDEFLLEKEYKFKRNLGVPNTSLGWYLLCSE
ncbi:hypothetical protein WKH57_27635 [Niallia taxi]|uniref:hypothetical protein n=1 Tax=Niallia taxi TaxID=2499688 RepID=UPI003172CD0E